MAGEDERKLFVAGLPDSMTEDVLRQLFEAAGGTVLDVSMPRDRMTGRPRGFGFVTLASAEQAAQARSTLDGSLQAGRPVSVRPFQSEAPRRDGGGRSSERGGERTGWDRGAGGAERAGGGYDRERSGGYDRGAGAERSGGYDRGPAGGGPGYERASGGDRAPGSFERSGGGERSGGERSGGDRSGGDRTLYVGNLPYDCSIQEVEELFRQRQAGEVARVHLPVGPDGRMRGFGFVTMPTVEGAQRALEALREADCRGRRLMINIAHPRGDRPERGGESPRSAEGRSERPDRTASRDGAPQFNEPFPPRMGEPPPSPFMEPAKTEGRRRGERPEKKPKKKKRGAAEREPAKRGRDRDWKDWDDD